MLPINYHLMKQNNLILATTIVVIAAALFATSTVFITPASAAPQSKFCYNDGFTDKCYESKGECKKNQSVNPSATTECKRIAIA